MALRAIADDGDVLALDEAQVSVLVIKNLHVFSVLRGGMGRNGGVRVV
jgi:hypothetical protein